MRLVVNSDSDEPAHRRNGSMFVFCVGDCQFKSKATPASADACVK